MTDRLSKLDKQQLLTLKANARRLEADAGARSNEATALIPLIDAELARRSAAEPPKVRAKRKA
jgi:hypothetical protein